jgi:hypothetical protein
MKAYKGPVYSSTGGFNVKHERMAELILFVEVLQIMGRSVNLLPSQLRVGLRGAIDDALQRLTNGSTHARALLPTPLP